MAHHRVFHPDLSAGPGGSIQIAGEEAHHAVRVRRLETGSPITLMDGRGGIAEAHIDQILKDRKSGAWSFRAVVDRVHSQPRVVPRLEVWAAPPKGPRLESMIDGLSQAGAASWAPLHTQRTVVEPREGKLDRMHRLAAEASKQCGRAWHLEIDAGGDMAAALRAGGGALSPDAPRVVVADASGVGYTPSGAELIRLLVGPEGGWTDAELEQARAAGAAIAVFGPHVMRVETAAVVACGVILDAEIRFRQGGSTP